MGDVLHALEFRLAYSECDPAGIVYYATYYPWMERTNTEWLYVSDARPDEMTARWGASPVARASSCTYHRPARVFDPIRCEMRLENLGSSSLTLRFDFVHRDDEALLCEGRITLVTIDAPA